MFMDADNDIDLGAFLVEKKILTPKQLKEAQNQHMLKGGYFSQQIIELGFMNDASLTTFLTCQYGYSYLPLKAYNIDDIALQMIPAQVACDFLVVPIEKNDKLLTVAMADPLNKGVVEILRQATHCEIIIFISTRSEILDAISKYYGGYASHPLDGYTADQALRDDLIIPYVSSDLYSGPNRRRYRRFPEDLDVDCYLYPNIIGTRCLNISLGGVLLESEVMFPKETQMALSMQLSQSCKIKGIVQVVRCESRKTDGYSSGRSNAPQNIFEIGAFFNFLPADAHAALNQLLRSKIPH
jgi:hypothetical protein